MRKVADKLRSEMLKEFNWQFSAGLNTSAIGQEHHTQTTALDVIFTTLKSLKCDWSRTAPVNCGRPSVWRRARFTLLLIWFCFNSFYTGEKIDSHKTHFALLCLLFCPPALCWSALSDSWSGFLYGELCFFLKLLHHCELLLVESSLSLSALCGPSICGLVDGGLTH